MLVDVRAGAAEPELVDARTGKVKRGVVVVAKLAGQPDEREVLEWDGPDNAPTPEQVADRLRAHKGTGLAELGEVEIGDRGA